MYIYLFLPVKIEYGIKHSLIALKIRRFQTHQVSPNVSSTATSFQWLACASWFWVRWQSARKDSSWTWRPVRLLFQLRSCLFILVQRFHLKIFYMLVRTGVKIFFCDQSSRLSSTNSARIWLWSTSLSAFASNVYFRVSSPPRWVALKNRI